MELLIQREPSQYGATYGKLYVDNQYECETIEDQIREVPGAPVENWKITGASAIPAGRYQVLIDKSTRFNRLMPHVMGVPGFVGVRIHNGNTAAQTEGCPLVGKGRKNFGPPESPIPAITSSIDAFNSFFALIKGAEEVWLTVKNPS